MNVRVMKQAIAFGLLALTASCTATPKSSTVPSDANQSQSVKEVAASESLTIVKVDGSSTVFPITQAVAKEFQAKSNKKAQVELKVSGTSGGFDKFCTGETDINNASRPITKKEMEVCRQNGIGYIELPVAFDALSVVVNPQNTWAEDITVEELKKIWEPAAEGKIKNWNQVRASYPNQPLNLYGAGKKSGTFDYFTEAIVGKAQSSRNDYKGSENDDELVRGIIADKGALGYFGYAYYQESQGKLKALGIDGGKGVVLPSLQTVEKAQYQPLSRPLFVYVNPWSKKKEAVYEFANFYIKQAPKAASAVGYVPLPEEAYQINQVHLNNGKVGTVFAGEAKFDLTISALLRKQKQF
ncbi:PstS family phosphate ABC transporter substrate-binding protein [Calothrix sp. UHCC 0171]|uniref:PstS family phosphate ABC transporter substrate-binding protein n=1 Tax=Calothrix sp. UHCC 0171 TaxID=3110245 RepID=UPI002B1FE343|nr:PstS family phosphate ABC transporter substrate-binding protein [Calothrix sp. UHCC 0171]MEA5571463.1 PstS family phosphate ABC transporter substrate-binding protein [Calothrix sp. UHCC 0171]